jgi:hypothetical protein
MIPGSLDPGEEIGLLEPMQVALAWLRRGLSRWRPRLVGASDTLASGASDIAPRRARSAGGKDGARRGGDVAPGLVSEEC